MSSWKPVTREYQKGDTIYDAFYNRWYFMPEATYEAVGAKNEHGSVEGQYIGPRNFIQYQSVMRNTKIILTEKINPAIREDRVVYATMQEVHPGGVKKLVWDNVSVLELQL